MSFRWKSEDIIFDSLHEADVWADSIGNEMFARLYDGYETPDYKIACCLAFRLAEIKEFKVNTNKSEGRYQIWIKSS